MNSRQKRKAFYAEHHEAPVQNHWVKTNEFGKIGDCGETKYSKAQKRNQIKMRNLKDELTAFGLWYKHTGSQKPSKLRAALKQSAFMYQKYQTLVSNYMDNIKNADEFVETPVVEMPESPTNDSAE